MDRWARCRVAIRRAALVGAGGLMLTSCGSPPPYDYTVSGATQPPPSDYVSPFGTTPRSGSAPAGPAPTSTSTKAPAKAPATTTTTADAKKGLLTKAAFIAEADKICTAGAAALGDKPPSVAPAEIESWLKAVVAGNRKIFSDVAALGTPDPGGDEWKALAKQQARLFNKIEVEISTLANDPSKLIDYPPISVPRDELVAASRAFGFTTCGMAVA